MIVEESDLPPSISVIEAVADAEGVDPLALEPPLHDVVDPEALDALFTASSTLPGGTGQVSFRYNGYDVVVENGGSVSVQKSPTIEA